MESPWNRASRPVLYALFAAVLVAAGGAPDATAQEAAGPSFIVINLDDLEARPLSLFPRIHEHLIDSGALFANAFATTPLCCPSRISLLRGQYAHNHRILTNGGDLGGFEQVRRSGLEAETLAVWLQREGYRTGMIGKYLNGYRWGKAPEYVPPGWDEWFATAGGGTYYDFVVNHNGRRRRFPRSAANYRTDVELDRALDFIRKSATRDKAFFLYWAPVAPHLTGNKGAGPLPPEPAPRHRDAFGDLRLPRVDSLNEQSILDKPSEIAALPFLRDAQLEELLVYYRARMRSLLAVDEAVEALVEALDEHGRLDDTYIVLTADNGFHQGEHRLMFRKATPYEEAIRVPLVIRGPGIAPGTVRSEMVLNIDLAPTLADLGDAEPPYDMDGRSLRPLLQGQRAPVWRQAFLFGALIDLEGALGFRGVRGTDGKLVQWFTPRGVETEAYDLVRDPHELQSLGADAPARLRNRLGPALEQLGACVGRECHRIEEQVPSSRLGNIIVLGPNGNESFAPGDRMRILWGFDRARAVTIELRERASTVRTLARDLPNSGRFEWVVPTDLDPSDQYRIRILSSGSARVGDVSDAPFTIVR